MPALAAIPKSEHWKPSIPPAANVTTVAIPAAIIDKFFSKTFLVDCQKSGIN
ncbi:hypothetical protein [Spiroplasma endosymbiont of Lasioglossum villosulum]|uniref:hypothetical protein n=1 Tax=Spiroplasma endosymbiont of Lasioglossum villosulum TaxID=3066320 RepID=UPI0030D1A5DF